MSGVEPLVLVVEDDERTRRLIRDVLGVNGFRTVCTSSGLEAIDIARRERPDIVVMDIQLPDLNGKDAVRRIRTHRDLSRVPVVAVTASVMPEERRAIIAAGFTAYRSKPIDVRDLLQTVHDLLAGAREVAS